MPDRPLPPVLRDAIASPLPPVVPLGSPRRRAVRLALVALAFLVIIPLVWGRGRPAVPLPVIGAGWAVLTGAAAVVMSAALRESTPAQLLSPAQLAAVLAAVAVVLGGWVAGFFAMLPWSTPARTAGWALRVCLSREYLLGLAPLALASAALARGVTPRPALAGALAGLAAGLIVESSWRLYCSITEPIHTIGGHVGAIGLLAATGALAGVVWSRLRG